MPASGRPPIRRPSAVRPGRGDGLDSLRTWAATLDPAGFWLSLRTQGHEFDRVGGGLIAKALGGQPAAA